MKNLRGCGCLLLIIIVIGAALAGQNRPPADLSPTAVVPSQALDVEPSSAITETLTRLETNTPRPNLGTQTQAQQSGEATRDALLVQIAQLTNSALTPSVPPSPTPEQTAVMALSMTIVCSRACQRADVSAPRLRAGRLT